VPSLHSGPANTARTALPRVRGRRHRRRVDPQRGDRRGVGPVHSHPRRAEHPSLWLPRRAPRRPGPGYATFLERSSPVTALGYPGLFALLEPTTGWRATSQALLGLVALSYGLVLGARALVEPSGSRVPAVVRLALASVPAAALALLPALAASDDPITGQQGDPLDAAYLGLGERVSLLADCFVGGPARRARPIARLARAAPGPLRGCDPDR
jgi:hypothetical protein